MNTEVDITKLRYVLYARKSTTDETRQVRSIDDQISDCLKLAKDIGLKVVDILKEERSAKKPNNRPIFTQMLKDIRIGKYDGILAWNPDRLARNMLEGGMLIDMIDTNIIKDLKFKTHHFTKDANGKMLLGMAFVLSKQYSDDLSQKVTRGVRKSFEEGKAPHPKHGYFRDDTQTYRPDGKNFELIRDAWKMRKTGESLEKIAKYMNDNGYGRTVKSSGDKILMTADILSTQVFPNPFYYGVLISEKNGAQTDLRDIEGYDFIPATDEETYQIVQNLYRSRTKPYNRVNPLFYPFKGMIRCGYCGRNMYSAPSKSEHSGMYFSYRCDNEACIRNQTKGMQKTTRVNVILSFIYDLFEKHLRFTDEEYKKYYEDMVRTADFKRAILQNQRASLQTSLSTVSREIKESSLKVLKYDPESRVAKENTAHIESLESEEEDLTQQITEIKEQLGSPEQDSLTLEDFLNLTKNIAKIAKSADAIVKDKICRLVFLNLTIDEEKVLSFQSKPPFDEMLKVPTNASSRGSGS